MSPCTIEKQWLRFFASIEVQRRPRLAEQVASVDSGRPENAHVASLEPECVPALFESKLPCAWIGWRVIADRHALGLSAAINGH